MTYIGNERQWKRLMEVDWLGQYGKAWIAFNAWYSNNFKTGGERARDIVIIEKIRNDEGYICSRIENWLSGRNPDQISFQSDLANLHKSLDSNFITTDKRNVCFKEVEDYAYVREIREKKHKIKYKVTINVGGKQRLVTIKNASGIKMFHKTINSKEEDKFRGIGWEKNLDRDGYFESLSEPQKQYLKSYLEETSPIHNLLADDANPTIIGPYEFTNNKSLIARSIIIILYQLRNALFHGEIIPDSNARHVYQHAYLILKRIIRAIPEE